MKDSKQPQIGQAVARGATAMVGVTLLTKMLASIGQFVIAVFVIEEELGRWVLALSLAEMFALVNKLGIREILVHRHEDIDDWVSSAFWVAAIGGVLTMAIIGVIAPFSPRLFNSVPEFAGLLAVAGVGFATAGFSDVFQAKLTLDFRFGAIAKIAAAEGIVRVVGQIVTSVFGMGAMGLLLVRAITWSSQAVALGIVARPKIKRRPETRLWKQAYSDSSNIFVIRVAEILIRRGDPLLLGLFVTDAALGAYAFAYGLSTQVVMLLAQSLTGALSAGLTKFQHDVVRLRKAFVSVINLMSFLGVPLLVVQAAACDPLLRLLYADKWVGAIAPLQILSLAACFSMAGWNTNAVFTARGLFRRQRIIRVSASVVFLCVMGAAASTGSLVIVAASVLVFRAVYIPIQVALSTDGGMKIVYESALAVLRPFNVAGVCAIVAGLLTNLAEPAILIVAVRAGEYSAQVVELYRLVMISSITLGLYYIAARVLLAKTYREFVARIRTVMPARIARRVPSWLL